MPPLEVSKLSYGMLQEPQSSSVSRSLWSCAKVDAVVPSSVENALKGVLEGINMPSDSVGVTPGICREAGGVLWSQENSR